MLGEVGDPFNMYGVLNGVGPRGLSNPLFPASGPATRSFNGLHPKSKFLALIRKNRCQK